eukprot:scaffold222938_cov30-Tisochrysis_lutea.AAC.2
MRIRFRPTLLHSDRRNGLTQQRFHARVLIRNVDEGFRSNRAGVRWHGRLKEHLVTSRDTTRRMHSSQHAIGGLSVRALVASHLLLMAPWSLRILRKALAGRVAARTRGSVR